MDVEKYRECLEYPYRLHAVRPAISVLFIIGISGKLLQKHKRELGTYFLPSA